MQSIRNSGADRSERVESVRPRQHGLFNSTALIPAMAAFAGGAGRLGAASLLHSTALVPAAIAVTAASLLVMPDIALAQTTGGRGGNNLGSGGASSETGVGADGAGNANSGGGGGAGVIGGKGGNNGGEGGASAGANGSAGGAAGSGGGGGAHGYFGATVLGSAAIGGNGGAGAVSAAGVNRGGGGGGAGGFGAVITGIGNLGSLNVNVLGGTGGQGGNGGPGSFGGYGGSGGVGLSLTGNAANLTINSSVTGGNGGSGGAIGSAGGGAAGVAGNGGVGLHVLGANSIVTIGSSGSVTGGNSGQALNGAGQSNGGVGITGSNLTLVVGGSVSAGTGVFGRANAVSFTGGTNVLEILSGATFLGNVVANSVADTLRLGGTANGTFDASLIGSSGQFRNFGVYEKIGTSTWTLTGSTSAATPWAINGGTLSISSDGALGASGPISFNGGTLVTTAGFTSARNITLNAGGGTISPATATSLTLSGIIGGAGALTKGGAGTLVLSGANTYSGETTVNEGTLVAAHNAALGTAAGGTSVANFATLAVQGGLTGLGEAITLRSVGVSSGGALRNLSGDNVLTGLITLASVSRINSDAGTLNLAGGISAVDNSVIVGGAGNVTFSGSVSLAAGQILKTGSGTLTFGSGLNLTGTTGGLILSQGTLSLQGNLGAGFGTILTTGSVIDFAQGINNAARVDLNSNTTQFQVTTGTATQSGVISEIGGARPIEKIGAGSLVLSGLNSYSGGTVISGGTLRIGADANLGAASGGITINNNANLTFTSALTTNRAITLSGTANIDSSSDITLGGVIGGTGTLTKFLGGTLTLTNTNNYSGGTTVNGGTLQIGNGGTTGTLGSGTVTLNGTNLVFNRSDDITVANDVTSTGTVIKRGGGTVTLTGGKSYSNTTVEAGTLALRGTSVLSGGGQLQMLGGTLDMGVDGAISSATHNSGTLALGGKTLSVITGNYALQSGSITGGGTIALLGNSKNFNIGSTTASIAADVTIRSVGINNAVFITSPGGDYTLGSNLDGSGASGAAGSLSVLINNLGFTTTLSGNNNHRLGTTVNSGTLAVGSDTALGTGTLFLNPNTALTSVGLRSIANPINLVAGSIAIRNTDTSNTFTLGGVITGSSGFDKTGAGTLILTGANTYTGTTTISAGTLQLGSGNLGGSLGSGAVSIASGASLRFDGSGSSAVTGEISGIGSVIVAGTGTATLSSATSNYSGGTTVNSGTLALAAASSAGTGTIRMNGGALQANSSFTLTNRLTVPQGADVRIVTAPGVTLTKTGDGTNPLDLVGTLRIATTGTGANAGTFRFSSAATTTGSARLIVESGTLLNTTSVVLPGILNVIELTQIDAAGTLNLGGINFSGTDGIKNLQGSGTLINNGATTRILGGSFSGNLSGTQNIISTGTLSLSGTSDFTGTTTVQSGTLTVSSAGALGTSASGTTVNSGATLLITGASPTVGFSEALTISGSGNGGIGALRVEPNANPGNQGVNLSGGVTLAADSTITVADRLLLSFNGGGIQLGTSTLTFNSEGTGNSTTRVGTGISGTGGVTKIGTGLLELNGNNTFTGPLNLNGGTLSLGGGSAVANTVTITQAAGTRLSIISSEGIGSLAGAGTVGLSNGRNLTVGLNNNSTTYAGDISGAGLLTKAGTGTFTLTGASNYSGGTTISAGALAVGSDTALGNGTLTLAAGTALEWAGTANRSISNAINLSSGNGFGVSDPNFTLTLGGVISGTSGFTKTGVGIVAVTGNNLLTGTITISAGSLSIGNGGTSGTLGTANVVNNAALLFNRSDNVTLSNVIGGTGFLFKNGSGTLTLSGDNSYSGTTQIFAGTLQIGDGGTSGSLGSGGVFLENASTLVFNRSDNITVASSIGGGGPLTKLGAGTLTLTGANFYVGTTIISAGTLQIGNGGTAGTLGSTQGTQNLGQVVNNAALVFNRSNNLTVTNGISGSGSLTKLGAATLTLSGRNTYDGVTTVSAGTLVALRDSSLGTAVGNTIVANGATLQIIADGPVAESITINGTGVGGVGALRFNAATQLGGAVTLGSAARINTDSPHSAVLAGGVTGDNLALTIGGSGTTTVNSAVALGTGNLVKDGTGTVVLVGSNTFGATTISTGTLRIGNGGTTGTLGSGNVLNNSALVFNRSNDFSVGNAITGAGTLTKLGARNLTLSGTNAYSGLTTVSAGTLTVNSDSALGNNVAGTTVSSGATLAFGTVGTLADAISFRGTGVGGVGALNALGSVNLDGNMLLEADGLVSVQNGQLIRFRGSSFGALGNAVLTLNTDGNSSIFVNSALGGIGGLIKNGAGQVQLAGNNSFTGPVTINAGVLQVTGGNAINDSVAITGVGSGRLSLDASEAIGSIAGTGSIGLFNNSILTTGGNNSSTSYSGQIFSTGGLVKLGTGTFTLTGDSSYLGTTTISGGTLQIGDGGTTGTLASGAVTNNATLAINLSSDITLTQLITGTGALRKLGTGVATVSSNLALGSATVEAGTLLLSGSNSFTTGITVAGGTLALRSANAAGGATGIIRTTGSVIDYSDGLVMATPIQLNSNTTQLQVLIGAATQSGVISETGGARPLEKIGAGTLTLSGTNTYSGGTVITAGRLNVASNANLGASAGGLTIGNAVLGSTATFSSARNVVLTGAAGIDVLTGTSLTLNGALSGTGSLAKTGNGQLVLTANSSYAGTTTISGTGGLTVGIGGTTGALGTGNITVNGSSFLAFNRSDAFTVANVISGLGNVGKQGGGIMTLTGANSFSGGLGIAAGTVALGHATGGVIDAAGSGTIQLLANSTLRSDVSGTLNNTLAVNAANVTVAAATGTTLRLTSSQLFFDGPAGSPLSFGSATLSGTIELAPVALSLGAAVNPIAINGGTLRLTNANAVTLLNGSNGVTLNGATLGVDVVGMLTKPLTIGASGGTIDVAAASLTLQGANTLTGGLIKTGAGELRLTGTGTGSGIVQLNAGTLALTASNAGWGTGALQMATGTTLRLGIPSPTTLTNNIVLGAGAGSTIIAPSATFSGVVSGGDLTIASGLGTDGPSIVSLTGNNSYGATNILAGNTLQIGTFGTGGTLGTGDVTVNTGATLRFSTAGNITVGNVISGAGQLVRNGLGTATLTAANNYSGGTRIIGSGIEIGNAGALGTGGITMSGGVTTASLTTSAGVSASVTGLTISRFADTGFSAASGQTLTLGGTLDIDNFVTSMVFGTLTKTGTVEIGFAPAPGPVNTAFMRVDAGTLRLGAASDLFLLRLGGGMTIGSRGGQISGLVGTLDLNGFAGGGVNLNGVGAIVNSSATGARFEALQNAASTFSGVIGGGIGSLSLLKSGTGALTLTGANSYTGTTSITGGSLQIGTGGTTGSIGTGTIAIGTGTQLLLNRSDAVSMANVLTGAGTVQKNLANTLTLSGANTATDAFTGTFNVNGGTLLVNGTVGDVTNRAATINVASGAALGGSGTIQGNVVVANGGILSPGNSPATQTIAGNLTLGDSSVLNFELAQAGVVGGGINDLISVAGNLLLDGTLNVTALTGFGAGFYRLFNYGGTLTNNQLTLGTLPLGFTSSVLTDIAGQVNILFNAGTQTIQFWDGADLTGAIATANGEGGAGSWSSTSTNWTTPTGFAVNSAWAGQAGVFAGAAGGTVSVTGTQAFQELRFLTNGYTLNSTSPTDGLATTGGFSIINVDTGIAARLNTPISGTAGLTKTGAGTLTLAGINSYAGTTSVTGGTLSLLSGGVIAGAVQNSATLTNGGTINGLVTNTGTLSSTGTLAGGLTNAAGAMASLSGSIGGAINNSGTISLTASVNSTAALVLDSTGILNIGSTISAFGSLAGSGRINGGSGGSLTVGGDNSSTTFSGSMIGGGSLVKLGTGTLTLTNATVETATLDINQGSAIITNGFGSAFGPTTVSNRANLTFGGSYAGTIANTGNLVFNGTAGSLNNLQGGTARVSGAVTLNFNNSSNVILTGNTTVGSRATLNGNSTTDIGAFDFTVGSIDGLLGTITLGGGRFTIGGAPQTSTLGAVISGNGELRKIGNSALTLTSGNTFTGPTTVSEGTLSLTTTGSLAGTVLNNASLVNAGSITGLVANNATLASSGRLFGGLTNAAGATATVSGTLNGPVTNSGAITLNGATSGSATLSQNASGTFNLAGFNATIRSLEGNGTIQLGAGTLSLAGNSISTSFGGAISGSGNLTKLGTGTLTLSGLNSFTGLTTINLGSILLATGASLASPVQNNATFINAGTATGVFTNAATLVSTGTLAGGLVNNVGATASLANTVSGAVTNSGAITLTAALSGSPSFTQNSGASLDLAGFNATLGSIAGNGTIQLGAGTLTAGASNASTSFDGIISGSGTFAKAGTGTLTLGGSNTTAANFTGTVTVNAGSLVLNGQLGDVVANSANLIVANGATLSGSGTFLGNLSLGAGGIFAPGNSPGTLTIGGNLLLDAASLLNFELAQAGVVGGGINDLITVGGNLTLDGTVNITALPGFGEGIYRLINYTGTLTDNGLLFGERPGGFTTSLVSDVAGQISVRFTQGVPTVLYWDGTDLGSSTAVNGNGGSGIWNSANGNWTSAPGFSSNFAWGGQTGVFSGAAGGTVQVSGTQAFQELRFETSGYNLNPADGTARLATTGGFSIIDVSSTAGSAGLNLAITGTGGLTKTGAGTLMLGGANSYTGLTSIAAGTLALGSGGAIAGAVDNSATFTNAGTVSGQVTNRTSLTSTGVLGGGLVNASGATASLAGQVNGAVSNSGVITLTGTTTGIGALTQTDGSLDLAGFNTTIGSLSGSGSVALGNGTLNTGADNGSTTFAGVISGNGGLTKSGTGTFTLTGNNSYFGQTTNASGTLVLANGGVISGMVQNDGVFRNAGNVGNQVVNNGLLQTTGVLARGLTNNSGGTVEASGQINGNITNDGLFTLTGQTTGIGLVFNNGTLNLAGFDTTVQRLSGSGVVMLGSGTLTTTAITGSTFAGTITGSGGLVKNGFSTFELSGANTYSGQTTILDGVLELRAGGSLAGAVVNSARFTNAGIVNGLVTNTGTGFLTSTGVLNGGLVNNNVQAAINISGEVNGNVSNAGTINVTGRTIGNASVTQAANGNLVLASRASVNIGSLAGSGSLVLNEASLLTIGSNNTSTTYTGTSTGIGSLVKTGTGTLTVAGALRHTGPTTVNGGTLAVTAQGSLTSEVTNNAALNNAGTLASVVNNGQLVSTGTVASIINNSQLVSTGTITSLTNNVGAIANVSGTINVITNSGTVTLTGTTTGIDALEVNGGGTVNLAGFDTRIGNLSGSGTVALGSATLTIAPLSIAQTFDGTITGSGGVIKANGGSLLLTGAQSYTGLTTVNAGTFILGNNASLAGALVNNVTVTNNGRTGGVTNNGRIAGLVTNNSVLTSTGALNGGLINTAGADARVRGNLSGAVTNAGTITLIGATTGIGAVTQASTGNFVLGPISTSFNSLAGSGSVLLGSGTLTTGGDNSSTSFAGVISGNGGLTKTGTGTFVVTGTNSYAGLTTVSQGVLSVRNNAGLGSSAAGTAVEAGAALELQGGITITGETLTLSGTGVNGAGALRNVTDSNIWAGTVTLGSDSLITADAGRLDIALLAGSTQALTTGGAGLVGLANATSTGTLTVTGGSTALFGNGSFAAGVTVSAGSLFLQGGSSIDDAAAVTLGTGNLIVAVSETIGSLAGTGGTVQIDAGQTLTLGGNDASTDFAGVIFNTGNLAKQGSGTLTVTGLLSHSGTTSITGGTLASGAANIWSGNGLVTIGAGGTLSLGGFEQSIAAINLAGGTLANGSLTGSITSSGGAIRDISGAANALQAIAGSTTLTGAGSFAQGVTLAGGDVVLQGAGASIADTALVTVNAGTLSVNVGETIGALAGNGGRVQIAAGQVLNTGGSNASTAYAGVLAGDGSMAKSGTGTFTLSGANTLTGTTTVSAGVLALTSSGSLAGAVQNNAGFSNAGTVTGLVTNTGTLISTGVLNGGLINSGSAGLSGQLNGAVTNSGLVQLQGGLTGITGFSQTANGTFDLAGFHTGIGSLSGAGTVLLGSGTLTLGGSNASTSFGGTISGPGGLTKTGAGSFTLTSGQAYTGLTTVNAGLFSLTANAGLSGSVLNNAGFASSGLILGSLTNNGTATLAGQINGAVANNGAITVSGALAVLGRLTQNAGGSLNLAGSNASLGSLAGLGPIQLGSGTLVVGSDNSSSLFSGVISGSGGLQKLGTGTFTLTGINSYSGLTIVNAGTLVIGESASVGGTTGSVVATVAAPAAVSAPVAVVTTAAASPIVAEQASMPAAVNALAADLVQTAAASAGVRAQMLADNGWVSGGRTPASLTSSAERLPLAGGVSSGPERVDLFADPVSGLVSADLPVVAPGEAPQSGAPTSASTGSSAARLAMVSDLSNGMGTARLEGAVLGGAEPASPLASALVDPLAPATSAGEAPMAATLSSAVIAGSVLNNANLINNGSILGQLVNFTGATAVNNGVIRGLVSNNGTFTSVGMLSGGLSNSGTARISGVLTGDVLNSGAITLTGITTGIAVFQQAASGSLALGGFDTTVGVLSGAGSIALGTARLSTGTNGVNSLFSGVISGTGALSKTGTGGLILEGDNVYTGGTTIAAGTLQLGNGGTTGSIIGPVINNGALIINRSNAYSLTGPISGTGMFVQAGTGTTTLIGPNSYTGGTLISAGRLIGSTVSLQGVIQNDAALEFAQATNGVFIGRIGGTGLLDKSGAGLLELTADSSVLRGVTTVRGGELRVTGSLAGSATTVLAGATLSGTGTVGGLIARSGSVISPGVNGLGMLGVNGAIQLQSGSTLRLQIQAPTGSDMLIGNSTLQLGGTAALTNLGGTYAFNSNYLLLQASGGRTGTFESVTGFGEFGILYRPELVYTANQVLLRMAPNLLTNIVGTTPLTANQRSVVSRIDAAVTAGYNPQPLFNIYALPNAQQPNAFDQLSGEVYATAAGVGIEQERLVREAVLGRLGAVTAAARQTPEWGNGAGAWGQVFGSWGDGERDGNAARYQSDRQGFITGIDFGNANSEGSWRVGAYGMHMTSKVSVDARGSRTEVEQTGGGLYAGINSGGVSVGMGASVTGVDLTSVRNIALPGFAETNRGRGDGRAVQGFAELSYAIEAGGATYRPFASVAAGSFRLDALTETGGAAALSVRRQSYSSGSITLGADGVVRMGKVQLSGTLAGRVQIGDRDPAAQIALAAAPAQALTIRGVQLDSFALATRLDATLKLGRNADLSIGYTGLIGKDTADHGARATLSVRF